MSDITWQFQAAIPGGPAFTINQPTLQVDACDVASVKVLATTNNIAVPIQPGTGAGDVVFLVVSSSLYDPGINYTVDALGASHVLDGPHILVGSGAVSLLNSAAPPQKLTFNNTLAKDIQVQVVVGRKIP
jgi:hypothetical protein